MVKGAAGSSRTALRNRTFRVIWFASVISGTCAFAQRTAAVGENPPETRIYIRVNKRFRDSHGARQPANLESTRVGHD